MTNKHSVVMRDNIAYLSYEVVCENPDGGDVIEGRRRPYVKRHTCRETAFEDAARWYRSGPNGPVRNAQVYEICGGARRRASIGDTHGPATPVVIGACKVGMWWSAYAILPGGARCRAGIRSWITRADALAEAQRWARDVGCEVIGETPEGE